ncbi:MAG: SDR family oxidoreductase [Bacteroidales bacterium]|nr:SDR family oxidoreductase [Bacteroidales bacterium]
MNILITGASQGIGKEIVFNIAQRTSDNILLLSRDIIKLDNVKLSCEKAGIKAKLFSLPYDITQIEKVSLYPKVADIVDYLDVIINNAGYLVRKSFTETTAEEIRQTFDVNFFGVATLIKQLLPLIKQSKQAHVVNIGSMAGFQGSTKFAGLSYYSASKAALATLTECLSQEYKEDKIIFNCLALGSVQTEMLAKAFPGLKAPVMPSEMGRFVADFALNGWKFFNGRTIPVSFSTP